MKKITTSHPTAVSTLQLNVAMKTSEYGHPQPTITILVPANHPWRKVRSLMLRLAAAVEDASTEKDGWVVGTREGGTRAYVYLEGCDEPGDPERGLEVLQLVALGRIWT